MVIAAESLCQALDNQYAQKMASTFYKISSDYVKTSFALSGNFSSGAS